MEEVPARHNGRAFGGRPGRAMACGRPRRYLERRREAGQAGGRGMAPAKETGRARRDGSTGRVEGRRGRRSVAKEIGRGGEPTRVDVDPWGAFFEDFWGEAAQSGSADRPEGGREAAKSSRTMATRPGRKGRSPRAR